MFETMPTCSTKTDSNVNENQELLELSESTGINVWGAKQEQLEQQALKELQIFTKEQSRESSLDLEDGEIIVPAKKSFECILDINYYIKRQEELKKKQACKRALSVSDHSESVAKKICEKQKILLKKGRKRINVKKQHDSDILDNSKLKNVTVNNNIDNKSNLEVAENKDLTDDNSGSEYIPSDGDIGSDYEDGFSSQTLVNAKNKSIVRKRKGSRCQVDSKVLDDALLHNYKSRLDAFYKNLEDENELKMLRNESIEDADELEHHVIKGDLKVPIKIWSNLYEYQQKGIEWLWEIHQKPTGGLLGDEMGLGKTVQIITFLRALEYSRIISGRFTGVGPSIIVSPATVINQWVQHFHEWAPEFRVAVLHQSGTFQGNKASLIKEIHACRGIIITTYLGVLKFKGNLLEYDWHYVILDEGHKIRNPAAKVSIAVKQLRTPHRLMLTGSPMQNNLTELWSLFDFTNPGMLGNLNTFQEHFVNPILQGGFANASSMQEATALSVATTLKNVITPYLLRRTKTEVQDHILLPNKSEQVLFCSLTDEQRDLYKGFLMSENVNNILGRGVKNWYSENMTRANILVAITTLRKICNHPDLYLADADDNSIQNEETLPIVERYGYYKRSGKMIVVSALLKIWKKQNHRVLLFSQGRSMITVFQDFLEQNGYKYLKMDGSTSVGSRQPLINKFNNDSSYDVFLLTTRVGGLGVNLTGASRVIIYDPDWNPATDSQARERAWRIGQEKEVTVYRLLSAGTIEEKMYQRQVWKQLLSNKILIDPKTHRFFKSSDLHDLFSIPESAEVNPETTNIFRDSRVKIQDNLKKKSKKKKKNLELKEDIEKMEFTPDKIQAMKDLAQQISKSFNNKSEEQPKKTGWQIELEEERQKKLQEKKNLESFTAAQLFVYNRKKSQEKNEEDGNKIDDLDTNISFSAALDHSAKASKLYHDLTPGKLKDVLQKSRKRTQENDIDHKRKKSKLTENVVIDTSGKIDGEEVSGLVKREIKKKRKETKMSPTTDEQNNYVLEKLFSRKGVSGALQHDSIVDSGRRTHSLKIYSEAERKAGKSLEALRKSRLNNWSW